jgi:uncharacterized protein (TIGR02391 family)
MTSRSARYRQESTSQQSAVRTLSQKCSLGGEVGNRPRMANTGTPSVRYRSAYESPSPEGPIRDHCRAILGSVGAPGRMNLANQADGGWCRRDKGTGPEMLPHGITGKAMKLRRVSDDGTVIELDIQAEDLTQEYGITFAVDADVEVGDEVTATLPNGKTKTMRLREVEVLQSQFGGDMLDHTLAKYDVVSGRAALRQPTPVSLPGLHPLISASSGSQIASRLYDNAVFDAFKAVEDRVQALTGHPKNPKGEALGGKGLMTVVFNEQNPLVDITFDNANATQKANEREGFKFLFMGAAQALRNPRGHGPNLQTGEQEAMEMLATASLLMRALDRAEARLPGGQQ